MKYCVNCVWSTPVMDTVKATLNCVNPEVVARDPQALASPYLPGTSCKLERAKTWFAACGRTGKLYKELE